jgi:hypothetical protein
MTWVDADVNDDDASHALLGDIQQQLTAAVTVSLKGALEAFRTSLSETIEAAVHELTQKLEAAVAAQLSSTRNNWVGPDVDEINASVQHAVLMALAQFEPPVNPAAADPFDAPATSRDLAQINQRIDELRSLLLG